MRAHRMLTGLVVGTVLLGGCSRKPVETEKGLRLPAGDPQAGRAIFEKNRCYTCHEVSGQSFPAPSLDRPVRLTQEQAKKPSAELAQSVILPSHTISGFPSAVAEGGELSKMGDFNRVLTVQDVADLVAFIKTIQGL